MLLNGYQQVLGSALVGAAPLNGMYAFYASTGASVPTITSGATLATITSAFGGRVARITNISQMPTSGGIIFVGTTDNSDVTIASPNAIYGFGVAALGGDTSGGVLLDYNAVAGGITVPANGAATLLDKLNC